MTTAGIHTCRMARVSTRPTRWHQGLAATVIVPALSRALPSNIAIPRSFCQD